MDEASVEAEIESLKINVAVLSARVRYVEKQLDTYSSPRWKRLLFRLDGWPPWHVVGVQPAWRPWRRWWRS